MKQYKQIAEITKQHLDGTLKQLQIQYLNDSALVIKVMYKDEFEQKFEYDLELDTTSYIPRFLVHNSSSILRKLSLDRNNDFELALQELFMKKV